MLATGGNAMDAAIATDAMLAVTYPRMCGLGGDLFWLYHEARSGPVHSLNGTGGAPAFATPAAFSERGISEVPGRGPLAITVPGAVGGWARGLERFGPRTLADLLAPAIEAAVAGVSVTDRLAAWIAQERSEIATDPTLRRRFLRADGKPLSGGAWLQQPELGADWVAPLRARHQGLEVLTTPPNSQGVTSLLMLDGMATACGVPGTARYVDEFVAAKRRAFAFCDAHVTDSEYMTLSLNDLLTAASPASRRERRGAVAVEGAADSEVAAELLAGEDRDVASRL